MAILTVYPDVGTGGSSVDGNVARIVGGAGESFSTLRSGAGTSASENSDSFLQCIYVRAETDSNLYDIIRRGIFTFDTSALSGGTVDSAIISFYGQGQLNTLGSIGLEVVSSTPASDNDIVSSDYSNLGSTSFGSVSYGSFSLVAYNDITLSASGEANISTNGVSKFGLRSNWDLNNNPPWSADSASFLSVYAADNAGTSQDPKLVITYTPSGINMQINISDVWKDASSMKINIGDVWKDVVSVKQNIGDVWKDVF